MSSLLSKQVASGAATALNSAGGHSWLRPKGERNYEQRGDNNPADWRRRVLLPDLKSGPAPGSSRLGQKLGSAPSANVVSDAIHVRPLSYYDFPDASDHSTSGKERASAR